MKQRRVMAINLQGAKDQKIASKLFLFFGVQEYYLITPGVCKLNYSHILGLSPKT